MTSNLDRIGRGRRSRGYQSLAIVAIGLAHFLFPRAFDPINRLGFPSQTRNFTYLNGAIETLIGVLTALPQCRRQRGAVSACYLIYLTCNIIRTQAATLRKLRAG